MAGWAEPVGELERLTGSLQVTVPCAAALPDRPVSKTSMDSADKRIRKTQRCIVPSFVASHNHRQIGRRGLSLESRGFHGGDEVLDIEKVASGKGGHIQVLDQLPTGLFEDQGFC